MNQNSNAWVLASADLTAFVTGFLATQFGNLSIGEWEGIFRLLFWGMSCIYFLVGTIVRIVNSFKKKKYER